MKRQLHRSSISRSSRICGERGHFGGRSGSLTGWIDRRVPNVDRVGLVGHSLGGYTVLALAGFFQRYLANRSEFQSYLTAGYARSLERVGGGARNLAVAGGNSELGLNLVRSAAAEPIVQALQQDSRAPKLVP
jgi:predicted dienelactone hydrolase